MVETKTKQLLHSDVLRQLYSTIALSVESQTDTIRKIHLLDGEGVTRTYAITHFYPSNWDRDIALVAAEIKQGKSLGETLQNHGYKIEKVLICATRVTLTNRLKDSMKTDQETGTLSQYDLVVTKGRNHPVRFATVTEIYSMELSSILEQRFGLVLTPDASPQYISDILNVVTI